MRCSPPGARSQGRRVRGRPGVTLFSRDPLLPQSQTRCCLTVVPGFVWGRSTCTSLCGNTGRHRVCAHGGCCSWHNAPGLPCRALMHCAGPRWAVPCHTPTCYAVLYCSALHCTALHCTALHCTATALHCHCHCTATALPLHCTPLHCTPLHCTALHCTCTATW